MNRLKRNWHIVALLVFMALSLSWCISVGLSMGTPEALARYEYNIQQDQQRYDAELARLQGTNQ